MSRREGRSHEPPEHLAELGVRLATQGDFAAAADALGRAASAYAARGQHADAARVWIAASRLAASAGRYDRARRFLADADSGARRTGQTADLLNARAELADLTEDHAAREAAWRACTTVDTPALAENAWYKLGALARERGDVALLGEAIRATLAMAIARDDRTAEADLRIELAVHLAPTDAAGAVAELDRAEALVSPEQHELRSRLIGQRGVLALARGETDHARAFARLARELAVEANAVGPFLASTSLLVMIHEHAGDQLAALDEILGARASLIDLLGEQGAGLVDPALTLFEERVGSERFRELVVTWREAKLRARAARE